MLYIFKIILTIVLSVLMALSAFGETPADSVKVYFLVGHSQFDPDLRNNRAVMDRFINIVREADADNNIREIVVNGYASPDGNYNSNLLISQQRCNSVAAYLSEHTGIDRGFIHTFSGGIAWGELRRLVAENPDVPHREKVIDILDNTPVWIFDSNGNIVGGRKSQLMSLSRGEPYRWLLSHVFPDLRNSVAVIVYLKAPASGTPVAAETSIVADIAPASSGSALPQTDVNEPLASEHSEETPQIPLSEETVQTVETFRTVVDSMTVEIPRAPRNKYWAIKTNMLFDAVLVPNIGAELYMGKDMSVYAEWMYSWWSSDNRHRFWRIYGGDFGLRWWFGRNAQTKPLSGHHLGLYGGALIFDFEWGGSGYMGGKPGGTILDRCLVNAGVEYGYSVPVSSRLNIDFSIGLGYLGGNYIKYFPFDNDYFREKEYKMRYFGPTKAEISLVWLLGHGNRNIRKGGER